MTLCIQDSGYDVVWRRKVSPSGKCLHSICSRVYNYHLP